MANFADLKYESQEYLSREIRSSNRSNLFLISPTPEQIMLSSKIADSSSSMGLDPLCSLPPKLAFQITFARYTLIATLSVFVWEILNNVLNDYKLLSEHRIRLPTVTYFISRVCCLGFVVCTTVFIITPLSNTCNALETTLDILFSITIVTTSLLFFFRTRAIFDKNPWIVAFFAVMWLAVVAGCLTSIVGATEVNVGPTTSSFCQNNKRVRPFAAVATIIPFVNDTLVFFAITWRMYSNSYARRTLKVGFRVLFFGDYLPVFSKAMLLDGQAYYLTTIAFNLITVVTMFNHSISDVLRIIFSVPNVALMNVMACRVFRNITLGLFREPHISSARIISRGVEPVISLSLWQGGPDSRTMEAGGDGTSNTSGITITKTVERST